MSVISLDEWRRKQAVLSSSKSALPQSIPWAELGLKPTDIDKNVENLMSLYIVLDRAWRNPSTVKSDFARHGAFIVANAASENFITTRIDDDFWGRKWCITEIGMEVKGELDDVLKEILQPTHPTD